MEDNKEEIIKIDKATIEEIKEATEKQLDQKRGLKVAITTFLVAAGLGGVALYAANKDSEPKVGTDTKIEIDKDALDNPYMDSLKPKEETKQDLYDTVFNDVKEDGKLDKSENKVEAAKRRFGEDITETIVSQATADGVEFYQLKRDAEKDSTEASQVYAASFNYAVGPEFADHYMSTGYSYDTAWHSSSNPEIAAAASLGLYDGYNTREILMQKGKNVTQSTPQTPQTPQPMKPIQSDESLIDQTSDELEKKDPNTIGRGR